MKIKREYLRNTITGTILRLRPWTKEVYLRGAFGDKFEEVTKREWKQQRRAQTHS
jgi:hypothetical protein